MGGGNMKLTNRLRGKPVLAVCFLTFLFLFSLCNIALPKEAVRKLLRGESTFAEFTNAVHKEYVSDRLKAKHIFIDLNGLFARFSGRRVYNEAILLNNGMLGRQEKSADLDKMADGIKTLADFVEEQGGDFLYVQMPCKMDKEKALLPEGIEYYCNEEIDCVLEKLEDRKVETMDLRTKISTTPEQIEQYYFSTDHHWNYTGAFVGFQEIAQRLARTYPNSGIDLTLTEWNQWESHSLEGQFLGSIGKRVGVWFAGVDDLTYYVPKFETEMSCAVPKYRRLFKGGFYEANMREEFLGEKDLFGQNNYCAYIGGDYPLVQHRNVGAASDLKVLIIKDSYTLPLQAYLSTLFQEIDVVDPRYYDDGTLADYIAGTKPDVVLMCLNVSQFENSRYFNVGVETFVEPGELVQQCAKNEIVLEPMDVSWNYTSVQLEPGMKYLLECEDIYVTEGETSGVVTALYDATTETLLSINIFDIEYCRDKGKFRWTFETPAAGTNKLQLLFYAGVKGQNRNVGTVYQGVTLFGAQKK